ncbi:hypothetical protein MPL3365_70121 [Mesorhizobium plurifarium]|uniref:Uncharacterized protein n=1 Tax=Mesorhizobium plurifarium TaxID=69974 RepID=A0A090GC31_MESPL|nr:hypothetical protein MPL3365_70121 [Mesorhizobium plurifarium]
MRSRFFDSAHVFIPKPVPTFGRHALAVANDLSDRQVAEQRRTIDLLLEVRLRIEHQPRSVGAKVLQSGVLLCARQALSLGKRGLKRPFGLVMMRDPRHRGGKRACPLFVPR